MIFPDLPHLKQLQHDLWQWPVSRAAVMVGAGLSLNAEPLPGVTTRFPTWRELAAAQFDELYPTQLATTPEQMHAREMQFHGMNALRIASEYEAAFGRQKLDLFIRTHTPDSDFQPGQLHTLLLQLPWTDVFTTNYDTLLERTDVTGRPYQPVTKASELTTAFTPRIVKLHGSFPSQTPFIITEEDYRTYPRQYAPFVNSVQQSLLEHAFVLLGFSGDDPNFLEWTGWIRDELGGNHAPIYLVGHLGLGHAQRSLLARRGVTPIDLAPVVSALHPANNRHAVAIEWFLTSLAAARPPRPEKWPVFDQCSLVPPENTPPLVTRDVTIPERVTDFHTVGTSEGFAKLFTRWQYERRNYPGWVVAPAEKRSELWTETQAWLKPYMKATQTLAAPDRCVCYRELLWRLETAMVPLPDVLLDPLQQTMDELGAHLAAGERIQASLDVNLFGPISPTEIIDAWYTTAFALLRDARETYHTERWETIVATIDMVAQRFPEQVELLQYERALWAAWNLQRRQAKSILVQWQPSPRFPQAMMWKAGLLAEVDEREAARSLLRLALLEIRRALRTQGQNSELLSLEGWCMYLLFAVGTSLDPSKYRQLIFEFGERWQELKAWECSPWPVLEYFKMALAASRPKPPKVEQIVRGFDPGQVTVTIAFRNDALDPYLPGFAYLRLYEQVGIPMRLTLLNMTGDALGQACELIAPVSDLWPPAFLVRAGNRRDLTKGEFLTRTQVAMMDEALVQRLSAWYMLALEQELAGRLSMDPAQEALLDVLPEVLSRLALRMDADSLRRSFALALTYHHATPIRAHRTLHDVTASWFRRLFVAAEESMLLEWLPLLILAPLYDESMTSILTPEQTWPDPMAHFPGRIGQQATASAPERAAAVHAATDWLLKRTASESGEGRRRAIRRLMQVFHTHLMTERQVRSFGRLLWEQRTPDHLPDHADIAVSSFLYFPAPANVDVRARVKDYILHLPPDWAVSRDANGGISIAYRGTEQPMIFEAACATKAVIQLTGEPDDGVYWTSDESQQLYLMARAWWSNDSVAVQRVSPMSRIGGDDVVMTLRRLGEFLSRAVLPHMEWAEEHDWQQLLEWLVEIRAYGVYPTVALPYVLLHRPDKVPEVEATIQTDISAEDEDTVEAAASAIRHWAHLSALPSAPALPAQLLTTLIERVAFRRKPGITACIAHISYLLVELPRLIHPDQVALLIGSLEPWYQAINLPMPEGENGDFYEAERPDLQVRIGGLAGALHEWYAQVTPHAPVPPALAIWKDRCAANPLPEVRRAFTDWRGRDA